MLTLGRAALSTAVISDSPPTVALMKPRMFASRHDLEILNAVVCFVAVDVVNDFSGV
jgi:hypothetical protein